MGKEIQKVEKLNKVTIEFTSERGDFRIIINDQVRENDKRFTCEYVNVKGFESYRRAEELLNYLNN